MAGFVLSELASGPNNFALKDLNPRARVRIVFALDPVQVP